MTRLREGGWGWFVVLGRFTITFLHNGIHKSLGVLLPHLSIQLNATLNELGWCTGVYAGLTNLLGPVSIVLLGYFNPRKQIMVGSLIASVSLLFAAIFAENFIQLLLAFTFAGIGQGLSGIPCIVPVTWYFSEKFALANGLSVVGGSVGMMVLPLLTQLLINIYGMRGSLVLLSVLSLHGCVAGALMQRPPENRPSANQYSSLPSKDENESQTTKDSSAEREKYVGKNLGSSLFSFCAQLSSHFHIGLFAEMPTFTLFQAIFALYSVGYTTWMVFLVPHGIDKGFSSDKAVFLSTLGGLGAIVGRVGHGPLVDHNVISDTRLFALLSALCGLTFLFDPLTNSFELLCLFAFIAGVAIGARYPLSITITKNLVEKDQFVSAMGWTHFFTGLGKTIGSPLTGWLVDNTGCYRIAFLLVGGIEMVITGILVLLEVLPNCDYEEGKIIC